MKKLILMYMLCFLSISCITSYKENEISTVKELNNENRIYLNELAKNEEFYKKLNELESCYVQENLNLLDELEIAIQKEKEEQYDKGFENGKQKAIDELIKNGYVILKIEDLQKYGLWEK